jgi:hypothetical protein
MGLTVLEAEKSKSMALACGEDFDLLHSLARGQVSMCKTERKSG